MSVMWKGPLLTGRRWTTKRKRRRSDGWATRNMRPAIPAGRSGCSHDTELWSLQKIHGARTTGDPDKGRLPVPLLRHQVSRQMALPPWPPGRPRVGDGSLQPESICLRAGTRGEVIGATPAASACSGLPRSSILPTQAKSMGRRFAQISLLPANQIMFALFLAFPLFSLVR